jgi:hypothetical protein
MNEDLMSLHSNFHSGVSLGSSTNLSPSVGGLSPAAYALPALSKTPSKSKLTISTATTPRAHASASLLSAQSSTPRSTSEFSAHFSRKGNGNGSDAGASSKRPQLPAAEVEVIPHDIDFIGTGSFQVSQLNLLQKRSLEPLKSNEALVSCLCSYLQSTIFICL